MRRGVDVAEPRCTGADCAYCAASKEHYRLTGCLERDCTDTHEKKEPERLDEGDLDAALARVRLETGLTSAISAVCACGENLTPGPDGMGVYDEVVLLDLVNLVAEHQPTCAAVKTELRETARVSIRRSGFKTKDDLHRAMGGDALAYQDPLVQEMLRQLPDGPLSRGDLR
jgi:hypothetical protein